MELGWEPKIRIAEGVKIMLENMDYWRDAPIWTVSSIAAATADWFKISRLASRTERAAVVVQ